MTTPPTTTGSGVTGSGVTGTGVTPAIDPRINERLLEIRRAEGRRRRRWVVAAAALVAVVIVAWVLLHTAWFSAEVITVEGVHPHTSTSAILGASGLDGHPSLIGLSPGATAARVESLPFIASATVRRDWPDGVTVTVTARAPAVTMAGPGSSWSVLDGSGRTLEVLGARPPGLQVLIVHTVGGGVAPAPVGKTLPATAAVGLVVCRTLPLAFSDQVVSVTVAPDATVSLALDSGITVLLGTNTDMRAKYEDVAAIIAHASLVGATTIDASVPQSPTVTG